MKKFLLAVVTIFAAIAMVGCNKTAKPNFEIPEAGYDGKDVTISFWHTMSGLTLQPVLDGYITEFNTIYPNIHIEHQQIGGYDDVRDQIKTAITVGDQPNMAYCYPDHVALYNKASAVVTLDNLITSNKTDGTETGVIGFTQAQQDDLIDTYYNEGSQFGDELMYFMPLVRSTEVLYYNKTFFDENDLTVPTTWDEMETVCAQIKTIVPTATPLGYDSEANWFITMCEQYNSGYTSATGNHFLFNNATNKGFIEEFKEWYSAGYFTTQAIFKAYTSDLFKRGTAAGCLMCIGSSAGASHQYPDNDAFEVGIAPIPQVDAENSPAVISQGPSVCLFKSENPQEVVASWLFLKYMMTNTGFQAQFSMASGYAPIINSANDNELYAAFVASAGTNTKNGVIAKSVLTCSEQDSYSFISPAFIGSSTARDEVGSLLVSAVTGAKTIDQAFQDAIDECIYQSS